jgi:hypothetical protein
MCSHKVVVSPPVEPVKEVCEWSYEFSTHEHIVDCYGAIAECDIDTNLIKTFKGCPYCLKPIKLKE